MDFSKIIPFLEMLYSDRVTVYRYDKHMSEYGSTEHSRTGNPFYEDIPCRVSFVSHDTGEPREASHIPLQKAVKLFVSPGYTLRAGDYVVAQRLTHSKQIMAEYRGTIGDPQVYQSHTEAIFTIDEVSR